MPSTLDFASRLARKHRFGILAGQSRPHRLTAHSHYRWAKRVRKCGVQLGRVLHRGYPEPDLAKIHSFRGLFWLLSPRGWLNTLAACGRARIEGEEVSAEQIRELEKMTQELVAVARKLAHGPDRETVLQEIREFRAKIAALKDNANRLKVKK